MKTIKSFQVVWFFFAQFRPTLSSPDTNPSFAPTPTAITKFIESIALSEMGHCSLFFFQDRFDNSDSLSKIAYRTQQLSFYNVKYAFPLQSQISAFEEAIKQMYVPEESISNISKNVGTRLPLTFPITVSNYRKRSDQCLLVILFLEDIRKQFITQIFNLLTPVYIPITRKDEDRYIFITRPEYMDELLLMRELPGRIKFRLMIGTGNDGQLIMKTACFFCAPGGQPKIIDWSSSKGYQKGFEYFPDFVVDLNGRLLQIACPYIRAKIEVDPPYEGVNNARRGIWKYVLEEYLMGKFNFSYRMFASTDINLKMGGGGTGLQLPNGTWTGVTGDLMAGRADLGVQTANTPKRILYIDFTNSFFDYDYLTFVTTEGSKIYSPLAVLWPFDIVMWICIGLCTIGAFIFFWIMIKTIHVVGLGDSEALNFARRGQITKNAWTFKYQVQFIITSYVDQDCVMPIFSPLRCFVAIWLFFTLVLTTIYRTKLVSLLAFPLMEIPPADFDQLAYSDYKVGFMKHGDSAFNTLAASTEPVYVKLVAEMELIKTYGLECLIKVTKMRYGCIAYESAIRHQTERNFTRAVARKLVVSESHTYNVVFGISTEGKSIFRINFGKYLSNTRSFDLQNIWEKQDFQKVGKLKQQWWASMNQSEGENDVIEIDDDNLTMKHISGAFIILFMFLTFGGGVFAMEVANYHKHYLGRKCMRIISIVRMKIFNDRLFEAVEKFKKSVNQEAA